jgi:hypothetical protein
MVKLNSTTFLKISRKGREKVLLGVLLASRLLVAHTYAQGGPPLLTDDPDTPGPGFWEINLATLIEKTSGRRRVELPRVDLNYGVGRRIQLKFEIPWVAMVDDAAPDTASGVGNATVGVKWRFVGQEGQTIAWAIYPQFEFNTTHSSVTTHLEDAGYRFLMPTELTIEARGLEMNAEIGRTFVQQGPGGWIVGLSTEAHVAPPLELLAEIRRNEFSEVMAIGGGRLKLTSRMILLLAGGHTVRSVQSEGPRTYMYAGLQLNVPRQFMFAPGSPLQ